MFLCVHMHNVCEHTHDVRVHVGHGMHVKIKGQLIRVGSPLPLCEAQVVKCGSKYGYRVISSALASHFFPFFDRWS